MFERFTQRARHAVVTAQDEARALGHAHIDTEHVLLGLLGGEPEAIARIALNGLGITLERSRREVEEIVGRSDNAPAGHIPFTPRAKKVLELALREALALGHNYIGTEHIALALVREGNGVAMQVVQRQGVSAEQLRNEVLATLRRMTTGSGPPARPATTPGADQVLAAAKDLAGGAPMGTHHLLEALAMADDSIGGSVLAALGVDVDGIAARIDEVDVAGTTDVTPELAAARTIEVHLDEAAVRIVLGDETTYKLVTRLVATMGNPI